MAASPFIIVAIDGGAASGKSSSSRTLSERFNLLHVDTGSFYRALTAELIRLGVNAGDLPAVRAASRRLQLGTRVEGRSAQMEIGGRVAADEIRSPDVNDDVSHFAAIPEVRAALLAYQRGQADVAREHGFRGLVMEGRDIGSVIFPDADFRFFLHARPRGTRAPPRRAKASRIPLPNATGSTPPARPHPSPARPAPCRSTPLT